MLTVTQLARRCGLSRTALLYYESIGLMPAPRRSAGNYRCYTASDEARLLAIRGYRDAGLSLSDIFAILGRPGGQAFQVLKRRLASLDAEILALRAHQQAILKLMGHEAFRKAKMITKEKWVAIMSGCGLTEEQMNRWHMEFERAAPQEHQEFLEFLHIPAEEIAAIRARFSAAN